MRITDHDDNEYSIHHILGDRRGCDSRGLMPGEAIGYTSGPDLSSVEILTCKLSDEEYNRLRIALNKVIAWIINDDDSDSGNDDDIID